MAPIGRVGLAFLLVLTLGAVRDGALAQTPQFALYDDFSSPRLDPARWAWSREFIREIRDGVLVLAAGGSAYTDANAATSLRHLSPPTTLTSLQADLRLIAATRGSPSDCCGRLTTLFAWHTNQEAAPQCTDFHGSHPGPRLEHRPWPYKRWALSDAGAEAVQSMTQTAAGWDRGIQLIA